MPTVGPNGESWCRGKGNFPFKFAMVECRGDWKWHLELWGLRRNYKAIALCHRCVASTRPGPNQYPDRLVSFMLMLFHFSESQQSGETHIQTTLNSAGTPTLGLWSSFLASALQNFTFIAWETMSIHFVFPGYDIILKTFHMHPHTAGATLMF